MNFSKIETETVRTAPALEALTSAVAAELDVGGPIAALCERLARILRVTLLSDGLVPLFAGRERSFVLYQDPHRGFIVNASVHAPGHRTPGHDHAEAWAIYGMYRGRTAYRLFDRDVDLSPGVASLRLVEERVAEPPAVAIVLPGQVHENWNPDAEGTSWNIVLRPRPLGELWRRAFDCETGRYHPTRRAK